MKRILLAGVAALGLIAPASAQVNAVPQVGVNTANLRAQTYVGQINGVVLASSATDFACINASSSKKVSIRRVALSGTAGTLITTPISLIRRNTKDTGTSTAMNITKNNTTNAAATASGVSYTANPTITDSTSHQTIRTAEITFPVSGTNAVGGDRLEWFFGTQVDAYNQGADLTAGSTQQFCLNAGAVTTGATVYGTVEWTEQ